MQTHDEILATLVEQLRKQLEVNGEPEARIIECLEQLKAAANDYHLPNQPKDVLEDLVDPAYY